MILTGFCIYKELFIDGMTLSHAINIYLSTFLYFTNDQLPIINNQPKPMPPSNSHQWHPRNLGCLGNARPK